MTEEKYLRDAEKSMYLYVYEDFLRKYLENKARRFMQTKKISDKYQVAD